jgi:choline dehydrogenase-like flavoprotein
MTEFDYLVVGGGTAGYIVAARLAEDPAVSVPQERGNSGIRQARLRILGGCSTANTMIAWRPRVADLQEWVDLGARGWDAAAMHPYYGRLQAPVTRGRAAVVSGLTRS